MKVEQPAPSIVAGALAPEILFVISALQVGGAELHLVQVAQALARLGWRVSVYAFIEGGEPLQEKLRESGVTVLLPPVERSERSWSRIRRLLRLMRASAHLSTVMVRRRPAIVHFFLPSAYLIGAPLALLARIPIRVMHRLSLNVYQRDDWRYRHMEPRLHRAMTAILGNSQSIIRELREKEGVPARRLGLIYSGIDVSRFALVSSRAKTRAELGLEPRTLTLVVVANLIPYKGHADLLQALALADSRLPAQWRLLVVGRDDGIGHELRRQAAALGLEEKIVFLGLRNDIPEILAACDMGVLASHQEGLSIAVFEGMAAGLPMVVTDVGGNREAVLDGQTGLLVPAHDPARLAAAIVRLANDEQLRSRLSAAARARMAEHFTLEQSVKSYDALYNVLLAGGSPQEATRSRVAD
jgi:glycosyltransferase involved in cell wall biosynthesis